MPTPRTYNQSLRAVDLALWAPDLFGMGGWLVTGHAACSSEELLRYDSPLQMTMRFAFAESPIGPHMAKRGDLVMVLLGAADRDPTEYEEPARLDIRRANASTHLSFGGGIHYCVGAPLARAEGQIAVGALLRRLPRLALGGEPLVWRPGPVFRGLSALPVTF